MPGARRRSRRHGPAVTATARAGEPPSACVSVGRQPDTPTGPHAARSLLCPRFSPRGDYYLCPPLQQLCTLTDAQLAGVEGFVVGRHGYGRIEWEGAVDVRGLDLDAVVCIDACSVDVYPPGCGMASPPVGTGLNRPALVTLAAAGAVAAAAQRQPASARAGVVTLRLARRGGGGARTVWTYAVPLRGGECKLKGVARQNEEEDREEEESQEKLPAAEEAQPPADVHQAGVVTRGGGKPGGGAAQKDEELDPPPPPTPVPSLRLVAPRRALDDVDD